ncbi:MAG: hypothetical protein E7580_01425 [Ruminococcaceae bacterium]|nr:hypothetical protein [Oscillospiraceae bacterium]
MNYWTQSSKNIYVAAHRGWSKKYPENTMLAFRKALELGVDQLETDVRITRDGELVLIHDATVDRTTSGSGKVCDMTLAELQELDAGSWKDPAFAGERIPKFTDLLELVKDHPTITLDIELKEYPVDGIPPIKLHAEVKEHPVDGSDETAFTICDRILKTIDDYGFTDRVVINTWSGRLHEYIYEKYGNKYRLHLYFPSPLMGKMTLEPYSFGYCCCMFASDGQPGDRRVATREECAEMLAKGIRPWAGTAVKTPEMVDVAIASAVELITCDDPELILNCLRERGYHK